MRGGGWGRVVAVATAGLVVAGGTAPLAAQAPQGNGRGVTVLRAQPPAPAAPLSSTTPALGPAAPAVLAPAPAVAPAPGRPVFSAVPSAMFQPCARPFTTSAATLGAAPGFDKAVTRALKGRPASAVVNIATPFAVAGDPPAALTPWLNQVKASGGLVSASEYCRDSRGMFGWIGRMFRAVRGVSYKAADGYDAVLHVDGLDQTVTQVEFKRRAP